MCSPFPCLELTSLFLSALGSLAPATALESAHVDPPDVAPIVLDGFVLAPDGAPAQGAVVVSSEGGHAVTDAAGRYRLEVALPHDVERVRITACGPAGANETASAVHFLSGTAASERVAPLLLVRGASCRPAWLPTFGGLPGTTGDVFALAVHDDGTGPALYVGGDFGVAGGSVVNHVARWDGSTWSALGEGTNDVVRALASYDDGGGPALYAGGEFTEAGGTAASRIAKWDGASWEPLGLGVRGDLLYTVAVRSLAVFDDGAGPGLYAGGHFETAGLGPALHVARWDGSGWSPLAGGVAGGLFDETMVLDLLVHDDGSGTALFAGGQFWTADGIDSPLVARWDGASWSDVGSGLVGWSVRALALLDEGGGPKLVAGGQFWDTGAEPAGNVAIWDGASWEPLGVGVDVAVEALAIYDHGHGPALHAAGWFTSAGGVAASRIARWDGAAWSPLGAWGANVVWALTVFDAGEGPELFAGGSIISAGDATAHHLARWNGESWRLPGGGLDWPIRTLVAHDDGSGPALYAGGFFRSADGLPLRGVARWTGAGWTALGSGLEAEDVSALAEFDDGSGPALYAGGEFDLPGGSVRVARWNGSEWSPLGTGVDGYLLCLEGFDSGTGPALYVGGNFETAGGVVANNVAKWDGASWSALGNGLNFSVYSLAVFDDGSGPALYAGGAFSASGGGTVSRVVRWDGASWTSVGQGLGFHVTALQAFDDGSGLALFAGGGFSIAGGSVADHVARWDGSGWQQVGGGMSGGSVFDLAVHDDGTGPALYAVGNFTAAGGTAANYIARWDGSIWSPLGGGMLNEFFGAQGIQALAVYDDGNGPALFAGGDFTVTHDSGDSYLAKWGCPDTTPPTIVCPAPITVLDPANGPPGETVTFVVAATDNQDPSPAVACIPPSGIVFPRGTTTVQCTATDASGNQASCSFPVTVLPEAADAGPRRGERP